jgi:5-methylcytosine-specific restriction endonuclease McrA
MGTYCYNFYHINRKGVYIQFTVDHKIPKCKNGQINLENAFPACIVCNEKKALYDSDSHSGVAQFNHVLKILDRI